MSQLLHIPYKEWLLRPANFPLQIEYTLITLDREKEKAQLSLIGPKILDDLQQPESNDPLHHKSKWRPEYAAYMIEGMAS